MLVRKLFLNQFYVNKLYLTFQFLRYSINCLYLSSIDTFLDLVVVQSLQLSFCLGCNLPQQNPSPFVLVTGT